MTATVRTASAGRRAWGGPPARRRVLGLLALRLFLGAAAGLSLPTAAEEPAAAASEVPPATVRTKAAYLYKIGAFVQWPPGVFASDDEPLVIGVLGADALADELTLVADARRVDGRRVVVRRLRAAAPHTGVHVLYLGDAPVEPLPPGLPLLTVADESLPGEARGVIHFVASGGRLRFDVYLRRAEAAGLVVSARLLGVARRVDAETP